MWWLSDWSWKMRIVAANQWHCHPNFKVANLPRRKRAKSGKNKRRCANTEILRCHRVPNPSSLRWRGRDSFRPHWCFVECFIAIKKMVGRHQKQLQWTVSEEWTHHRRHSWGLKTSAWGDLVRLPWCTVFQSWSLSRANPTPEHLLFTNSSPSTWMKWSRKVWNGSEFTW